MPPRLQRTGAPQVPRRLADARALDVLPLRNMPRVGRCGNPYLAALTALPRRTRRPESDRLRQQLGQRPRPVQGEVRGLYLPKLTLSTSGLSALKAHYAGVSARLQSRAMVLPTEALTSGRAGGNHATFPAAPRFGRPGLAFRSPSAAFRWASSPPKTPAPMLF
jgi:hypothetical protein